MVSTSKYGQWAMAKSSVSRSWHKRASPLMAPARLHERHKGQSRQSQAELSQAEPWQH